ncbi:hypothetical protein SteCoe_1671 [Stentor coeruleus]|uniref:Uncharacterized protein n=1 Tax=Stentor coeruleus TaxID=5963 RepID=A0A1R2D139_9CILI|nr:hypothetical protein SteCoe_1671 [Stentor coeruleus]
MGCGYANSQIKNTIRYSVKSLPLTHTSSRSILDQNENTNERTRRKSHHSLVESNDFWGTMPFYVLNNRIRLLSAEVDNDGEFKQIVNSVIEILSEFYDNFDNEGNMSIKNISEKYRWISKYDQGINLIRALGLNEDNKALHIMDGVTKTHLSNKIREVKYSYRKLKGSKALYESTV